MPEGLDKLAGAIGDTLKTAPTLYNDTLQPTVQEVGKFAARIPRAINAAFSGLDKWILNKEYAIDETKKLLEKKLENVDPDKIVEPEAYVAVPAIQAISYSMNSEELRNLYANLLAKAMNSDTKDRVHPACVNIISQITPLDAKILQYISIQPDQDMPIIDLNAYKDFADGRQVRTILQTNVTPIDIDDIIYIALSIDNLSRNKLIHIFEEKFTNGYEKIYNSKNYIDFFNKLNDNIPTPYTYIGSIEKVCCLSDFGKFFCDICIN